MALARRSATSGAGALRQDEQTGIRETSVRGAPHTRQSSGKTRLNGTAMRDRSTERSILGLTYPDHRLGKTHLRHQRTV